MKTENTELLDYNEGIDPIDGDDDLYQADDLETEDIDDANEIAVDSNTQEPDPEDEDLDATDIDDEDDELLDDEE